MKKFSQWVCVALIGIAVAAFTPKVYASAVTTQSGKLVKPLQSVVDAEQGNLVKVKHHKRHYRGRRYRRRHYRRRHYRRRHYGRHYRGHRRYRRHRRWRRALRHYPYYYGHRSYYHRPYRYRRYGYGRCGKWRRRCAANWGYRNKNYYGCLRHHGC